MKHRTLTLATLLALVSAAYACAGLARGHAQQRRARRPPQRQGAARRQQQRADYSRFSHATAQHQKSCASCHQSPTGNWDEPRVRERDAAFPDITDYPEHASCLNCHRRQFFSGARPAICSVCHEQVSPRSGARLPFENPPERFAKSEKAKNRRSEFYIDFPHATHLAAMAGLAPPPRDFGFARASFAPRAGVEEAPRLDSCSVCHETYQPGGDEYVSKPPAELPVNELKIPAFWLKRGMLKTVPGGHASCFNCHWQDGGERPHSNECGECHKLRPGSGGAGLAGAAGAEPAGASKAEPAGASKADADTSNPSVKGIEDADVLARWATRRVARFRHEGGTHDDQSCTACHVNLSAAGGQGPDAYLVPIKTCASQSCHGAASKGAGAKRIILAELEAKEAARKDGKTFDCTKCHINLGRQETPKSHTDLFPK